MRFIALLQDVRYGLRTLRKNPGFTIVAVAMLALGIGINTAVFAEINAALFQGFPLVHRNDRLAQITTTRNAIYYPDFAEWRSQATSFEGMALVRGNFHTLADGGNAPETYFTSEVSANTFQMVGVKPVLGRDFSPADERPGAAPVVMLRYEVWATRFAANPAIVGHAVRIDGLPATVIGVMPEGFSFPTNQDLWTPLVPTAAALRRETYYARYAYARLADGMTIESARAEMDTIGQRLARAWPRTNRGVAPVVKGFAEWYVGANVRTLYETMWGAVGFVLLIVCANVANLLIAQAIGRSREISVRMALGAERWRIIQQFLVESLMLSLLGGVIGWWIAKAAVRLYASAHLKNDVVLRFTMDAQVLAYLIAITVATGLLAGLATAIQLTKLNVSGTSRDESRGVAGGRRGTRLAHLFVGAQMALAVVLLAGAGIMLRSFLNVYTADVGVDTSHVLMMAVGMAPERYPSPESWAPFYQELETRLQALPGVASVGIANAAPTDDIRRVTYELADAPAVDEHATVAWSVVSTGYFQTLGAKVISGRALDASDRASGAPVAIVNQQFAKRNWPGEAAVGKRVRLSVGNSGGAITPWLTVVGVVSNIAQNDRTRQAFDPVVYVPYDQHPSGGMFVFVRTSVAPGSLASAVRREIYAIDPVLSVSNLMPLGERLDRAYALERSVTVLFLVFAVFALLLASVGLYAAVSRSVNRRIQEIGIRIAIGANGRDILGLVFKQGGVPVGTGLAIGIAVSFAVNRVVKSQLVGVSPADPVALVSACVVLVVCAALGCWIPARRAMRVDPIVALKHE